MISRRFVFALCASVSLAVIPALPVLAQGFTVDKTGLNEAAGSAGYTTQQACNTAPGGCIPQIIGQIVSSLLGVFGALFFALIIYGGAQYMLAGGDTEKVKSAVQTIRNAILGMLIVAASYAITTFVLSSISGVTSGARNVQTAPTP